MYSVPNIDAMTDSELAAFRAAILQEEDVPLVVRDKLCAYAALCSESINSRAAGNVATALAFEVRADAVYEGLPPEWRW